MIKELGEVIRLENNFVWVQTIRQSTCGACQARHGCGQKLLNQFSTQTADIKARIHQDLESHQLSPGDQVEIGISENAVVLSSMVTYGFPIVGLVVGVSLTESFGSDVISSIVGFSALVVSAFCVNWVLPKLFHVNMFEPVVLRLATTEILRLRS